MELAKLLSLLEIVELDIILEVGELDIRLSLELAELDVLTWSVEDSDDGEDVAEVDELTTGGEQGSTIDRETPVVCCYCACAAGSRACRNCRGRTLGDVFDLLQQYSNIDLVSFTLRIGEFIFNMV